MLQAILRLRIFCNHADLGTSNASYESEQLDQDEELTLRQQNDEAQCTNCGDDVLLLNQFENSMSGTIGVCDHVLCQSCSLNYTPASSSGSFFCPACDKEMEVKHFDQCNDDHLHGYDNAAGYSSKLRKLVDNLAATSDQGKR